MFSTHNPTARAVIRDDFHISGVKVALVVAESEGRATVYDFGDGVGAVRVLDANMEAPESAWLRLPEPVARALYESLAEHYGHTGHDTRALRKDYDAERARVDRLIGHLIEPRP